MENNKNGGNQIGYVEGKRNFINADKISAHLNCSLCLSVFTDPF